jgi:hypothetical protein
VLLSITGVGSVVANNVPVLTCATGLCFPVEVTGPLARTALTANGAVFQGWSGLCSGTGACTLATGASGSVTAVFIAVPASVAASPPAVPVIEKATVKSTTATFRFASRASGTVLECALVRRAMGKHAKQPKPVYSSCGTTKTYRHLHKGSYTLWVQAVASGGTDSGPVQRSFKIA